MLVEPFEEPWANNYERQADDAFNIATQMSANQLRKLRPPLPQIRYLPPRFGYMSYADRQWDVLQVFNISRSPVGAIPHRVDYSQSQGGYAGSDRNTSYDTLGSGGIT